MQSVNYRILMLLHLTAVKMQEVIIHGVAKNIQFAHAKECPLRNRFPLPLSRKHNQMRFSLKGTKMKLNTMGRYYKV